MLFRSQDDLERVTKMAYAMVVDYGMSDRLGPLSYKHAQRGDEGPLLAKPYSDATAEAIDEEVQSLIDEAQSRATALLQEKRSLLDEMADALLREEVLDSDALLELLGTPPRGNSPDETASVQQAGPSTEGSTLAAEGPDGSSSESAERGDGPETPEKTAP